MTGAGRFAPSPSGDLHVGNLRTALLGWLFARTTGRAFRLRIDDLDRVVAGADQRQVEDLVALGLDWDGPVLSQSSRSSAYAQALIELGASGRVYPCFCTRSEIQEAASAPQSRAPGAVAPGDAFLEGAYPGTCRNLTADQVAARRWRGRPPALRLRADVAHFTVIDELWGAFTAVVDDLVLRRGDGVIAYNLAVVLDDAAQGVDQVVRGDDLLASAPRQSYLASLLGIAPVSYAHVPLAVNVAGARLAKRDGAVTMAELRALGHSPQNVLTTLAVSLNLAAPGEPVDPEALLRRFDPQALPRDRWVVDPGRW